MKNYKNMNKEELLELVDQLQSRKKYGLVWEDKPEDVVEKCKEHLPVLEEVADRAIEKDENGVTNLLIEGDNYHALSVLNYTHAGKVDVIYIDPPYNTGARDWKYNNDYVDANDAWRHSKWLSFMEKRLLHSKSLLSEDGILVCAIDHYELFTLGLLMDEIFGEPNRLGCITVVNKADGRSDDKFFATANEYLLFYAKNAEKAVVNDLNLPEGELKKKYPKEDEQGRYILKPLMSQGVDSLRKDRPTLFYPVYYDKKEDKIHFEKKKGLIEILPIDTKDIERRWSSGTSKLKEHIENDNIVVKKNKNGNYFLYRKKRAVSGIKPKTFWYETKYNSAAHGTKMVDKIIGKNRIFNYPKALYAVKDAIHVISKPDSVVLDYFAGSGTTAHAVLELNREDGGNRRFILCTNNENGIAEEVTYPRVKNVIDGYADVEGITANLRYFKTAFVKQSEVSDDTRRELVTKSTEMICVKEGTYKKVYDNKKYKVYKNNDHLTGILFDLDSIKEFKEKVDEKNMPAHLYIFSLSHDTFEDDFADLSVDHTLCPIPESILEVYRKLFA